MLDAVNSVICIDGSSTLFSNTARQLGGAVNIFQSVLVCYRRCIFRDNEANSGGAIYAEESTLNINGEMSVASSIASTSGGGLYLYHSILNCKK